MTQRSISRVFFFLILMSTEIAAQTLQENLWIPNGDVSACVIDSASNTIYIGGNFDYVGPITGMGGAVDVSSGYPDSGFPKIRGNCCLDAVVPDGSGGWYIGGGFISVGGIPRNGLAHIRPDKTVDPDWNPNPNNTVLALGVSGSTIYAGGFFTSIGGQARSYIAALDATTGAATSWDPNANNGVSTVAVSGSTIYVGGFFSSIGGQTRNYIAALDASSGSATSWNPSASGRIITLAVSGSTIYVGGEFTSIGGEIRSRIAELDASTGSATSWNPGASGGSPLTVINCLAVSGSTVYAGGRFTSIGGQSQSYIAALEAATGSATSWNPSANGLVYTIAVSNSIIYTGGEFTSIGGQPKKFIAALNASTGNATSWDASADSYVYALAVSGSTVYAGGTFNSIGGRIRNSLASLDATTGSGTGWNPGANGLVRTLAVSGSTIYAGGEFTTIGGQTRNYIAALDASSGSATSWNPSANGLVRTLAVSGLTIYAGGEFTTIGGQNRNYIAALDASSGSATSWNPSANGLFVYALAVSGSTVYAGGYFTSIGGQTRNYIAALSTSTGTATSWNPNANSYITSLVISGSIIYAGGTFTSIGGQTRNYIAALSTSTGTATSWNPNAANIITSLAASGSTVYAGGDFTSIGGQTRNYIAALSASTGTATNWNPNASSFVNTINLSLTDTKVYVGGIFGSIGGEDRRSFAGIEDISLARFTITATAGANGSISPSDTVTVSGGSSQIFMIAPNTGYHVDSVVVDGERVDSTGGYTFNNVTTSHTIRVTFAINAYTISAMAGTNGSISPAGVVVLNYGGSQHFSLMPDIGYHVDSVIVDGVYSGSDTSYDFSNVSENHTINVTFASSPITLQVSGWAMVSVPVTVGDYRKTILFPAAVSDAFAYEIGYVTKDTLANGNGYWLQFPSFTTIHLTGGPIMEDSITVTEGWNLTGSISFPISTSNITSNPPGISTSRFFGYIGTYVASNTIEPGQAYWVKVDQSGKLFLSSTVSTNISNQIRIVPTSEMPPPLPSEQSNGSVLPKEFSLAQCYPNPFNPSTVIRYQLPVASHVKLRIFNLLGQEVKTLVDGMREAGYESAEWDASNNASGVYFYRIDAVSTTDARQLFTQVKKMVLIK